MTEKSSNTQTTVTERVLEDFIGKTFVHIEQVEEKEIYFIERLGGAAIRMYHSGECCEDVHIDDVCGDFDDLVGVPILYAREMVSEVDPDDPDSKCSYSNDHYTWTFYTFSTIKGCVSIRWEGSSNGCYSESVDFDKIKECKLGVDETGAMKRDAGKIEYSLLMDEFIEELVRVRMFGADKYEKWDWLNGLEYSRYMDAIRRHLKAFNVGEDLDRESGLHHLAHLACSAMFLYTFQKTGKGVDDRHGVLAERLLSRLENKDV